MKMNMPLMFANLAKNVFFGFVAVCFAVNGGNPIISVISAALFLDLVVLDTFGAVELTDNGFKKTAMTIYTIVTVAVIVDFAAIMTSGKMFGNFASDAIFFAFLVLQLFCSLKMINNMNRCDM